VTRLELKVEGGTASRVRRVVIGTVPYLNVQPLIWALETGRVEADALGDIRLRLCPPTRRI
jgi:hypothetical protein